MTRNLRKSIRTALFLGALTFLAEVFPLTALAGDDLLASTRFTLGGGAGLASYNQSIGSKFTWGAQGTARLGDSLEIGIAYRAAKLANDESTSTSVDIAYLLGEVAYRIPAGGGHFTAGLEFGDAKITTNLNLGIFSISGESVEKFAMGPKVGFQLPVAEHFELGVAADYLVVFTSEKTSSLGFLASAAYVF